MGVGWECKNASATAYAAGGPGPVFHQKILQEKKHQKIEKLRKLSFTQFLHIVLLTFV